jgi:hypothetical protein
MKRGPTDGLLGMWALTFDKDGDIDRQFQILRRTGDAYIVQLYSLENGRPDGKVAIPRKTILKNKLYESVYGMNEARDAIQEKRRERVDKEVAAFNKMAEAYRLAS